MLLEVRLEVDVYQHHHRLIRCFTDWKISKKVGLFNVRSCEFSVYDLNNKDRKVFALSLIFDELLYAKMTCG